MSQVDPLPAPRMISEIEYAQLLECLRGARLAIAQLRPAELRMVRLPTALNHMSAIVESTEVAAHQILSAAEEIMVTSQLPDRGSAVHDACMRIVEACAFQDLAGQRIQTVVMTLLSIEDKLAALEQTLVGHDLQDDGDSPYGAADYLAGPSLPDEGVSQDEIDRLMS
jgi:chemotaxis protein CheZ